MEFTTEKFDDCINDLEPILKQHYEEIAWKKDKIKLNPNYDTYRNLEKMNMLRMYIVRDEGKVIGYAIFLVHPFLHYKDTIQAHNDILYIHPEYRGSSLGKKLLKDYAETELKKEGVKVISLHIKTAHNWQKLAEHWGYEQTEVTVQKWIGD